jgi:hypothetical protein
MFANILNTAGIRWRAQLRGSQKCNGTRFTLKCKKLNIPVTGKTRKQFNKKKKGTLRKRALETWKVVPSTDFPGYSGVLPD